jgi:hypothetical protein
MTINGKNIAGKNKIKLLRTNKMFCLRLTWLVVAYPMQVNKFDFGRVSFLKILLVSIQLDHTLTLRQPQTTVNRYLQG